MRFYKSVFIAFVFASLFCTTGMAQQSTLPHSTPEAEGVSSQGIINFIDAANKSKQSFTALCYCDMEK